MMIIEKAPVSFKGANQKLTVLLSGTAGTLKTKLVGNRTKINLLQDVWKGRGIYLVFIPYI
jgi:hypothetical protein